MADGRASCHSAGGTGLPADSSRLRVALVGTPNVGKSALFNRLTGRYVTVSNYPGTSVEISRGAGTLGGEQVEVIDTPGMYSLTGSSEEQRMVRRFLFNGGADVLVQVADAKNLSRMLSLTLQLVELGRPTVLAVNMMDEAVRHGIELDVTRLSTQLGIAVVPIVAVEGSGIEDLKRAIIRGARERAPLPPVYGNGVGTAMRGVGAQLAGQYPIGTTALAALLIQADEEAIAAVRRTEADGGEQVLMTARRLTETFDAPVAYKIALERQQAADDLARGSVSQSRPFGADWGTRLGHALARPSTGIPALLVVLYLGLYKFVGQLGGGTMVDWLERVLFGRHINPFFERLFLGIPWEPVRSLFVGEYGLLTLGVRYAVAVILPIVGAFFLFFSLLEDSGYFPRLALLVDRTFKRLGLSGRAVIPIVLGLACDTMATMVTRTLETKRERVLATFLLALAIPCSAQLGVIMALMAQQPLALSVWLGVVIATFVVIGALGARVLPGEGPVFHMELPPLRRPRLSNVVTKTVARMQWYFLEVLPLFLLASVFIWLGHLTGVFELLSRALGPLVRSLGLPPETATVFLFGFFRRDYGAAGLFDLQRQGVLDVVQVTVAAVTLTLFIPCVAQFLMMLKERGVRTAVAMFVLITPIAFGAGFLLNLVLRSVR
ncbi:MAG: ferrous iron transport protein B [Gemmatimonadetes bacterium]|nr:ferrous iron transport protein B [Gemmatimonadota bacterium]